MSLTEMESYRELILENIEYDCLKQRFGTYREDLDEIVELLVETVCAKRKTTRIAGADFPHEVVRSRFLKLDSSHIEFVMGNSEDLSGVEFIGGTRPGNPGLVDLAKRQVGNVGGYPYWSWYGFNSRVEWCACFVSWCYNQAGKSEPRFAGCQSQGVPWFQSHGQWGGRGYANIAPGDAIFFDWACFVP